VVAAEMLGAAHPARIRAWIRARFDRELTVP
jgi:hypothetical protein